MSEVLPEDQNETASQDQLEQSTYEIIRNRLRGNAKELRQRLEQLNQARRDVFGSITTELLATERITSTNNCVARDLVPVGEKFIFGYNVQLGLKSETDLNDVFAVYRFEGGAFLEDNLELIGDATFQSEFRQLYKYYKSTTFARFQLIGPHLYMVFQVGKTIQDIKAFKWVIEGDQIRYVDNRSDHEVKFPSQHEFEWIRTHRDLHRAGLHPHISIEDRLFVEAVGGDLTIKVEDNTEDGEGIYSEPVEHLDQTLDDADIFYAIIGNIIVLKMRPYQEKDFRYLAFNEKTQKAMRLDGIADACVLLPEDHGIIFSKGYFLQTGEYKTFENDLSNLVFERRIASPNGEDYLFVFHNQESGENVLLSYNVIEQQVETPIICNGFSVFSNGHMVFFRGDNSPQKHHALQIWQTPYVGQDFQSHTNTDSFLYKIGNKDIVRAMSESHRLINLIDKDDSYANLYFDLVRLTDDILDSYFWLGADEAANLKETLVKVREASSAAVDEFDRVVRVRKNTEEQFKTISKAAREGISDAASRMYQKIDDYVQSLASLRQLRGEVISLRDLKYVDVNAVESLENEIQENTERISHRCVEFLLRDDALAPYEQRVQKQRETVDGLEKVTDAKALDEDLSSGSNELEMLIDIVSNLKIDDATQRTRIIDGISAIYSKLNQARAALKKKHKELLSVEGIAEFNSQLKLLSQAVVNYLDVCDSPERCDEYLTKMMVQVEELEGRFAEFDEFVVQLAEKREEIYAAFDTRKISLVEARNRRATTLMSAADRILKGIRTRVSNFKTINEINSYFAADLMIEKIRDIVEELKELEDSVKVDDIQSRLKTIREDTIRQLKDKQELYVDGENVIRFGKHRFSVNVQPLDLTTVMRNGEMSFHLTGTKFFEPIEDEGFLQTKNVWQQEVVSENSQVYRGEYLAYQLFKHLLSGPAKSKEEFLELEEAAQIAAVQKFMGPRYAEGYVKGVHDHDATKIVRTLLEMDREIGQMRYHVDARALANLVWFCLNGTELRAILTAKLAGAGQIASLFQHTQSQEKHVQELGEAIQAFVDEQNTFDSWLVEQAAQYLFTELALQEKRSMSHHAANLCRDFLAFLERHSATESFESSVLALVEDKVAQFALIRDWVSTFVEQNQDQPNLEFIAEAASVLLDRSLAERNPIHAEPNLVLDGMFGSHARIDEDRIAVDFNEFMIRLDRFEKETVTAFESFTELKRQLTDEQREGLRLEEFKPRVLTSFVRNKLIDEVYLPLVGDNLAKQMGVVGEDKRTDLMGLLLLISPPGYGKTTLMEYIANRLGITFMKINGPAIGHHVTSLDPTEAPNASAREEVEKLNLALEMGDNVMIYLDDIQHCNPELLQKFISLCDATRRIEGVYKGKTRTYDLRGRKVAVVMAGNPYTESGDKFQIPDMLANRADTYNLGDVVGGTAESFELSYLENCLTSNPILGVLQSRSRNDVYAIIEMATQDSQQGISLEGNYSVEEINELVAVMKKLLRVRDVLLKVNQLYIRSAAQADEYRTEPPFKLQGSYRDMNKMAEKIVPIMNDEELQILIDSHFENQAQTLTTGAEANLLKFKELTGQLSKSDKERWEDIKRTFKRNVLLGGAGTDDKFGQIIAQMTTFTEGLNEIRKAVDRGWGALNPTSDEASDEDAFDEKILAAKTNAYLESMQQSLMTIGASLQQGVERFGNASEAGGEQTIEVVNRVPRTFLEVIKAQFAVMAEWIEPLQELGQNANVDTGRILRKLDETLAKYEDLSSRLRDEKSSSTESQIIEADIVSDEDQSLEPEPGRARKKKVTNSGSSSAAPKRKKRTKKKS